jgi:hypothetical protein
MNNACAWFKGQYTGAVSTNILIIPTNVLGSGAGFNEEVGIMQETELKRLRTRARYFFSEFKSLNFNDLTEEHVQSLTDRHKLSNEEILTGYSRPARPA